MIFSRLFRIPDGHDLLREEVCLDAPILSQLHYDILDKKLVIVEQLRLVGIEEIETGIVVDGSRPWRGLFFGHCYIYVCK